MKKSLLLIPSLVALGATPFICLSGCKVGGEDKPEPTPPEPVPTEIFNLNSYMKNPVLSFNYFGASLSSNTWYEADVDTTPHASDIVDTTNWMFALYEPIGGGEIPVITMTEVWIDGSPLKFVPGGHLENLKENEFIIVYEGDLTKRYYVQGKRSLDGEHIIKIQFKIDKNVYDQRLSFEIYSNF